MAVNKMNRKVNLKSKTNRSVLKSKKTKKVSKTMNGGSKCGSNILKGGSKCGSNILKGGSKCGSNILKGGKSVKRKVSKKQIKQSGVRTLKKSVKKMKPKRQNKTQKKCIKNKKYRSLKKKIQVGGDDRNIQKIGCHDGIELLLKDEGDFLIRKASEGAELLVKTKTSISQYKIAKEISGRLFKSKTFKLEGNDSDFKNLSSLIEHHKKNGIETIPGSHAQQENVKLIHEIVEPIDKLAKETLKNCEKGDYVYLTNGGEGGTLLFVYATGGVHTFKIKSRKDIGFYTENYSVMKGNANFNLKDYIDQFKKNEIWKGVKLNNQIRFTRDENGKIKKLEYELTKVSREMAEQILENKKIGDFVLRTTSSSAGFAVLSVKVPDTEKLTKKKNNSSNYIK